MLKNITEAIGSSSVIDRPADILKSATEASLSAEPVDKVLSGSWLGHPVHPLLVTMPIGSWSAALIFDLVGDSKTAQKLIALGIVTAGPAMVTGASDWRKTEGKARRVGFVHVLSNSAALGCFVASYGARRRNAQRTGKLWAVAGATLMSLGGYLGGELSYSLGVGVEQRIETMPRPSDV